MTLSTTVSVAIRPALIAELPAAAHVYRQAATARGGAVWSDPIAAETEEATALADLSAYLDEGPDRVWVAEERGAVVAVAAILIRERQWFLAYLFVLPTAQGRGIGHALLDRTRVIGAAAGCHTYFLEASRDPRALALYLGAGFVPQPPLLELRADAARLRLPPPRWDDGLDAIPLRTDEPALIATAGDIDRAIRGARRPRDLVRWLDQGATGSLLLRRDTGAPAGYFLIGGPAPDNAVGVGPLAVLDAARQPAALTRALVAVAPIVAARPDRAWWAVAPGQNAVATAALLAAGFRPVATSTLLSTASLPGWDRYLPAGQSNYF